MSYRVLIVEDETTLASNLERFLSRHGYEVKTVGRAEDAVRELERFKPDAVLLDYNLPGMNGLEFLAHARGSDPQIKVVMATGHGSEMVAVQAMKTGAYDYLVKPLVLAQVKAILDGALREEGREKQRRLRRESPLDGGLGRLIGESPPMRELKELLNRILQAEQKLADDELPAVLITGETGTGKELVARALHFDGQRARGPFVEMNCSSIPANLLEAELFGYERGAFTDAKERKPGLIESAEGGTLFLDELGEMDLTLQAKLLKFLEDRMVRPLGSVREQRANARIVAATNRNLEQLVREGRFRSDLFFRLRIVHLELPALRSMPSDIPRLAHHYLARQAERYGKPDMSFSGAAISLLQQHAWPGNVRELRNVIEQSVILASGPTVEAEHLKLSQSLVSDSGVAGESDSPTLNLVDIERGALVKALEQTGWNVSRAARLLGVSRDVLRYRIDKYRLKFPG